MNKLLRNYKINEFLKIIKNYIRKKKYSYTFNYNIEIRQNTFFEI